MKKIKFNKVIIIAIIIIIINNIIVGCKKVSDNNNNNNTTTTSDNIVFNPNLTYGNLTDYDGNVYKTITIGTQTWMAENLKVIHYRNGDPILYHNDNSTWASLTTGAYCDYGNISGNGVTYGKLYNGYAVCDSRNIAPNGWHVPTDIEWTLLASYLGGDSIAGGKLKEIGTTHWNWENSNIGATNISGFTALPGGDRNGYGVCENLCNAGFWWTSTELPAYYTSAFYRILGAGYSMLKRNAGDKFCGYSVRCIKD